mmetsp:Transcript_17565/g.45071  ORF Transcript_17565/g.45071 Transcript_17565/m.45071 type:complete len:416 (+) Transcript_17565:585-1832(+)
MLTGRSDEHAPRARLPKPYRRVFLGACADAARRRRMPTPHVDAQRRTPHADTDAEAEAARRTPPCTSVCTGPPVSSADGRESAALPARLLLASRRRLDGVKFGLRNGELPGLLVVPVGDVLLHPLHASLRVRHVAPLHVRGRQLHRHRPLVTLDRVGERLARLEPLDATDLRLRDRQGLGPVILLLLDVLAEPLHACLRVVQILPLLLAARQRGGLLPAVAHDSRLEGTRLGRGWLGRGRLGRAGARRFDLRHDDELERSLVTLADLAERSLLLRLDHELRRLVELAVGRVVAQPLDASHLLVLIARLVAANHRLHLERRALRLGVRQHSEDLRISRAARLRDRRLLLLCDGEPRSVVILVLLESLAKVLDARARVGDVLQLLLAHREDFGHFPVVLADRGHKLLHALVLELIFG